jgi:acyl-CoA thioesterase-1
MIRLVWLMFLTSFLTGARAEPPVILVLGDSLSAAYGIRPEQGWVALLEERLRDQGLDQRILNASISGETTAGGVSRLTALLNAHRPALVVIALGANDGLRALPLAQLSTNLERLVGLSQEAGAQVLLVGITLPPNYGAGYVKRFQEIFVTVAGEAKVPLVPMLLTGVAEHRQLMQPDGYHPAAEAQPIMLENVWTQLRPLLWRIPPSSGS